MASAFSDSLMASGRELETPPLPPPPHTKISETRKGMIMKFLLDIGIYKGTQNHRNFFAIIDPV